MSRDFVGALLQLNAEKQVSREALVRALEEGIQAAYRRVAGEEDIFVRVEPESGRIDVYRGRYVVDEVEDPMVEVTVEEARETKPDATRRRRHRARAARRREVRPHRRPDGQADHPPADPRGRARPGVRPVREPRGRAHHGLASPGSSRGRSSSTSARAWRRSSPRASRARSSTTASASR